MLPSRERKGSGEEPCGTEREACSSGPVRASRDWEILPDCVDLPPKGAELGTDLFLLPGEGQEASSGSSLYPADTLN